MEDFAAGPGDQSPCAQGDAHEEMSPQPPSPDSLGLGRHMGSSSSGPQKHSQQTIYPRSLFALPSFCSFNLTLCLCPLAPVQGI